MSTLKGTARSAFSVFIAGLLITSLVAPAAFAGSASAQVSDDGVDCSKQPATLMLLGSCIWDHNTDSVNDSSDRDAAYVQSDHHAEMRGEYETAEQFRTVFDNYAQDTGTIASLEARNAIATAYENNKSASTADAKAQTAIQDYYSKKEINTLEAFSKQQAQLAYTANSTTNHPDALHDFVYPQGYLNTSGWSKNHLHFTGDLHTRNYTLSNGTQYEYHVAEIYTEATYDSNGAVESNTHVVPISKWQNVSEASIGNHNYQYHINGLVNVKSSYAGTSFDISNGHPAQVVVDYNAWADRMTMWANQSDQIESNYAAGTASDLYTEMDAGRLDPADVRGAEGQVRFLSGDSNATDQRYIAALYGTLNMEQAGFNSTFYVEYTGATELTYNRTVDGSRTANYTGYVENQSYQGMVFSSEIPSGGFQPGNTYNTSDLNGTTMIYSQESGTVTFAKGNLTIKKITDEDGNKQDSVTWEKPKYDTNNVDEYVDYLNRTQQMQLQLIEAFQEDTSSGSTTTESSGWSPTQNQMIAIFIAIVAMLGMASRGAD